MHIFVYVHGLFAFSGLALGFGGSSCCYCIAYVGFGQGSCAFGACFNVLLRRPSPCILIILPILVPFSFAAHQGPPGSLDTQPLAHPGFTRAILTQFPSISLLTIGKWSITFAKRSIASTRWSITIANWSLTSTRCSITIANWSITPTRWSITPTRCSITSANWSLTPPRGALQSAIGGLHRPDGSLPRPDGT